ncbi:MAG: Rrf2 family transcriptional regulator [Rikenellaceae bacterium]|nr:Rrf2 family transcriptional regulator [Rikenellaceae bacterium]
MLSKKTRYALLALIKLAGESNSGPIPISLIAESEKIPQRFLEGILLELKKNGYVESTRGKTGGYYLSKNPAAVTILEIITLMEGSVGLLACVSESAYKPCEFCKDERACKLKKTFRHIYENTSAILGYTTLQDLA